ncbi:hypothetical protein Csa_005050 [Cucumis sativus]|nr:hypothetical protein Csa_005050 [Cucumis sativus]
MACASLQHLCHIHAICPSHPPSHVYHALTHHHTLPLAPLTHTRISLSHITPHAILKCAWATAAAGRQCIVALFLPTIPIHT